MDEDDRIEIRSRLALMLAVMAMLSALCWLGMLRPSIDDLARFAFAFAWVALSWAFAIAVEVRGWI